MTASESKRFDDLPPLRCRVTVQREDFDVAQLQRWLLGNNAEEGAIATFTGYVRADKSAGDVQCMELEHYPGMTESCIESIVAQARERWPIQAALVVHRVGRLYPAEQIVWVGVSSGHRAAAFNACEFIMDYLKAEAPLWKKVFNEQGEHWIDARDSDSERAERWLENVTE